MENKNLIQANGDEVVDILSNTIAQLTRDNAVSQSLINQYQAKINVLEKRLEELENAE
mgnify:CR=1 FL=1